MTTTEDSSKVLRQLIADAERNRAHLVVQLSIADTHKASCLLLAHIDTTHAAALRRLVTRLERTIGKLRNNIAAQNLIIAGYQAKMLMQRLMSDTTTNALRAKGIDHE